jgi:hypothetical protein
MKVAGVQRSSSPQGLRPEIARIIEALARAAIRREDRRLREASIVRVREAEDKEGDARPRSG